jgi:hypothetical protein
LLEQLLDGDERSDGVGGEGKQHVIRGDRVNVYAAPVHTCSNKQIYDRYGCNDKINDSGLLLGYLGHVPHIMFQGELHMQHCLIQWGDQTACLEQGFTANMSSCTRAAETQHTCHCVLLFFCRESSVFWLSMIKADRVQVQGLLLPDDPQQGWATKAPDLNAALHIGNLRRAVSGALAVCSPKPKAKHLKMQPHLHY